MRVLICVRQNFLLCCKLKANQKIKLDFEGQLRYALPQSLPRIQQHSDNKQEQILR